MIVLIVGLLLFMGAHSVRVLADPWRTRMIARIAEGPWKGLYSLVSLTGFGLIVWGFRLAGRNPVLLYVAPASMRHANAVFTLIAFVLLVAAYVPRNHFKAALGHPMVGGVAVWALGHLLAIGMARDVILFGAFLLWAVAEFAALRRRDRRAGAIHPAGTFAGDAASVVIGAALWAGFAFWLHARWIGVDPFT